MTDRNAKHPTGPLPRDSGGKLILKMDDVTPGCEYVVDENYPLQTPDAWEQPLPEKNDRTPIVDLVLQDIERRVEVGLKRYGTKLQAFNGRDPLRDAYEEALDLVFYLRQCIEERDNGV